MGFIRRFSSFPGLEVIRQIEGVTIVDLPPPGSISGVGTGTMCMVGEFEDCSRAVSVSSSGVVSTLVKPFEVFSSQDMINKAGGFDETLGEFGKSLGNGFVALRNKKFSRLIIAPVNIASAQGARFFRQLPLCASTTNTLPVVPVSGASIAAGSEFRSGVGRIRIAKLVQFTARAVITTGVDGSFASASTAVTQTFSATGGFDWTTIQRPDGTLGARKGDILVVGNNNAGAKQPTAEAGTYRVAADPSSGANVSIERLDGVTFAITTQGTIPWRLHFSTDADSAPERVPGSAAPGGYSASEAGGYVVPVRPLTNSTGGATDGTYTAGTQIAAYPAAAVLTGSSADPLAGVAGRLHVTTATAFTANIQKINAPAHASIDALYQTALDATLGDDDPVRDINLIGCARKSATIRSALKQNVLTASQNGRGRTTVLSPDLQTVSVTTVAGSADPGVGANRHERIDYSWPGALHSVPEAVGFLLGTADGLVTDDGILDDSFDHWALSLLSVLAPERNPGQGVSPVTEVFAPILGLQRGVSSLGLPEYTLLRAQGVMALKMDRTVGPIIQSGVTTSLTNGEKNVNRRRMADFIEDSLAEALIQFNKLPVTQDLKDTAVSEVTAFLDQLLSPGNPAAQRIVGYTVDAKSGNTPDLEAQGVFVIIVKVRTLATADFIVLQAQIAEGVDVTVTALAA